MAELTDFSGFAGVDPTPQTKNEPPKTVTDFMAMYGAQAALAASDPEIMNLLVRAMQEKWTTDRFKAEFLNTKWAQDHGDAWQTAEVAKASKPGEYAASKKRLTERIQAQAIQLGLGLDPADAESLADSLLHEYWGTSVPDYVLSKRISEFAKASKIFGGSTMNYRDKLREFAASMGVKFDSGWFDNAAKSTAAGESTIETWNQAIKDAAKSRFPMFADQIDAGQTIDYIVSPYKQTLSNVLEIPYTQITLDDPTLLKAFGSVSKDGKPAVMGVWDYERSLRNDPRWSYTKNARASIDSVARKVLKDFGLAN